MRNVALAGILGFFCFEALPCGFHSATGLDSASWGPLHPKSLDVAIAVREAGDRKLVDPALLDVKAAGPLGYARATRRLRDFSLTLDERPTAVLFVESGLWSRLEKGVVQPHVRGALPGDVVVVTSEAVVAALLDRRLSLPQAIEKGLIIVEAK